MNQIKSPVAPETETTPDRERDGLPPSMEETIAEAWKEIAAREMENPAENPVRDADGKFAKQVAEAKDGAEGAEEDSPPGDDDAMPDAPTTERRVPNTWRKTAAAEWAKLSPVVQEEILKRENDVRQGIEQYRDAAARATSYDKTISPYLATIRSLNMEPHAAIGELLAADHRLRYGSPHEKAHYFAHLAKSYGVDAGHIAQLQHQQQPQIDPQVAALMNEVNALKSQQAQVEQHRKAQVERSLASEIAGFSKDKEHFHDVAEDMANLVEAGLVHSIGEAYEKACRMNDGVQRAVEAKRLADHKAAAAKKAKDARNAASVNVPARGTLPAKAPLGSMEDTIRAEAKRLGF